MRCRLVFMPLLATRSSVSLGPWQTRYLVLSENSHPHVHIERLMLLGSGIAAKMLVPPEVS